MVQVLESNPSFGQQLGRALGEQGGKFASQFAEDMALKRHGIDVTGLTGYARDVGIKEQMKRAAMIEQGRRTLTPQGGTAQTQGTMGAQPVQGNQPTPGQMPPSRKPSQERPLGGTSKIIIPPEQIEAEATRRATEKLNRGVATDLQTEVGLIHQDNANVAQYQEYQTQTGNEAVEALEKYYPGANEQQKDSFRKIGEQAALMGLSRGETKAYLTQESRRFSNELRNLEKVQGARARHKIGQAIKGTLKSTEERDRATRAAIKPFLDRGDYTTVRDELSRKGYGPEEIESYVSTLSEPIKKTMGGFNGPKEPSFLEKKRRQLPGVAEGVTDPTFRSYRNDPEGQKQFATNLQQTLQSDPNVNLILLRKAYEDKGVDWSTFKDEFDNLINGGQFSPTDDQINMLDKLQEPPLDRLDKILSNFNLIGR
jgi:hypothetical protein